MAGRAKMLPKPQDAAGWSHQPRSSSCSTPSLLAEAKDHANRSSVAGVVDDLPAGNVRDSFPTAVDEVELQGTSTCAGPKRRAAA
jgi:hypothetical protein